MNNNQKHNIHSYIHSLNKNPLSTYTLTSQQKRNTLQKNQDLLKVRNFYNMPMISEFVQPLKFFENH